MFFFTKKDGGWETKRTEQLDTKDADYLFTILFHSGFFCSVFLVIHEERRGKCCFPRKVYPSKEKNRRKGGSFLLLSPGSHCPMRKRGRLGSAAQFGKSDSLAECSHDASLNRVKDKSQTSNYIIIPTPCRCTIFNHQKTDRKTAGRTRKQSPTRHGTRSQFAGREVGADPSCRHDSIKGADICGNHKREKTSLALGRVANDKTSL